MKRVGNPPDFMKNRPTKENKVELEVKNLKV
jgi:hypothetical protein